jgi:acyl-coenzyme A synthetase/AMP-(fatty) acid ligase
MKEKSNFSDILLEQSLSYPDKIYCQKINGTSLTFFDLERFVNKCCWLYDDLGINFGDIVTIHVPNSISFIIFYFAGIRSGIKVNPCPSTLSERELIKNINFIESRLLITHQFVDRKDDLQDCTCFYFKNDEHLFSILEKYKDNKFKSNIRSDDVSCIYYSSGTTGNTKCIQYTHDNMISLVSSIVKDFKFNNQTKHLGVLPLGHTAIINYSLLPTLYAGGTLILADNFNSVRADIWKIISCYDITYLQIVPTILFSMLSTPYNDKDVNKCNSLSYVGCGSAPLSSESQINFSNKFNIQVANLYGLSETGPSHFDNPLLPGWKPGSIGRPLTVNTCKILGEDMNELGCGEIGQIAIKGKNVFNGYYKNNCAYKDSFYGKYFLTGDLGYKDNSDKFYFVDRKKDLIIRAGVNIVPGEIEEVIFKLKNVKSVAVVGVPHRLFGEEIVAFVEKMNSSLRKDQVIDILAEHLQLLKRPSKIIFVNSMPKTPSGKILKRKLLELYVEPE